VKRTVNFDDPGTYHLYFGNDEGTPGSILTFFPWPGVPRGTVGNGQVSATSFAVPPGSLDYWASRMTAHQVVTGAVTERFGEPVMSFEDPDGLPLELIATGHARPGRAWSGGSVDAAQAICGFHSATLAEEGYERTASLLVETMGWKLVGEDANRYRYAAGASGSAGAIVDIVCAPDTRLGRSGGGTVHHIAWRTPDDAHQKLWRSALVGAGYNVSPVMDRTYFHSIYYREPGGVLFEIATDPPGFAIDESRDHLGERLMLPDWLESQRAAVVAALPPLVR